MSLEVCPMHFHPAQMKIRWEKEENDGQADI